eukprot:TRINITY_DN12822_c0_g1_i1.p1 TRINITY_DN12822_c0_g1~~TRINITY_DN12822_c0_g1_i1.p1  ORF type:complete len:490 (-),score=53.55 TRINITY_DN12822_c0_g1_i1:128-1504(-)
MEEDLIKMMLCRLHESMIRHFKLCGLERTMETLLQESQFFPYFKPEKFVSPSTEDLLVLSWSKFYFNKQSSIQEQQQPSEKKQKVEPKEEEDNVVVVGSDEVPMFPCGHPGCEGIFTTQANMRRHQKLHTGEKPYACIQEGCGKSFARKYDLKVHTRIHTKEKPYECKFAGCDRTFSRVSSLREHERNVHNVGKKGKSESAIIISYSCPDCALQFQEEANLQTHMAFVHRSIPATPASQYSCCGNAACFCLRDSNLCACAQNGTICGSVLGGCCSTLTSASSSPVPSCCSGTASPPPATPALPTFNVPAAHEHHPGCGHMACVHDGHADFLVPDENGVLHLQHLHGGKMMEHVLRFNSQTCSTSFASKNLGHAHLHQHGPNCGHYPIRHEDHVDYLVGNVLHHPVEMEGGVWTCHDHGLLTLLPSQEEEASWDQLLNCSWDYCSGNCGEGSMGCRCFQ